MRIFEKLNFRGKGQNFLEDHTKIEEKSIKLKKKIKTQAKTPNSREKS